MQSGFKRKAFGQQATSRAFVFESPLANRVTSCPSSTNSSVRYETTRSVPPYSFGGTLSYKGETWAIRRGVLGRIVIIALRIQAAAVFRYRGNY
jgi:hypothetical protein